MKIKTAIGKDVQTTTDIIEELQEDEDNNGGIENNANGTGVEEDDMIWTENVRLSMDLEYNGKGKIVQLLVQELAGIRLVHLKLRVN